MSSCQLPLSTRQVIDNATAVLCQLLDTLKELELELNLRSQRPVSQPEATTEQKP